MANNREEVRLRLAYIDPEGVRSFKKEAQAEQESVLVKG